MTDYHPLIARAVDGLDRSTGEARRTLYERARNALVTQLRSVAPALSESEITKERLALEEAIRKVEAEAARKARTDPRSDPRKPRPPVTAQVRPVSREAELPQRGRGAPPEDETSRASLEELRRGSAARTRFNVDPPARPEAPRRAPTALRDRLTGPRGTSPGGDGTRGFRDVVNEAHDLGPASAKAAQSARDTRDSYRPVVPQHFPTADEEPASLFEHGRFDPQFDNPKPATDYDVHQWGDTEPAHGAEDERGAMPPSGRPQPPRTMPEEAYQEQRPPRSYRGLAKILLVLIILAGVVATLSWQWSNISGLLVRMGSKPPAQAVHETPSAQPKFSGRVPQETGAGAGAGANTPNGQAAPSVAQRVVLYEEDPNDPQGRRNAGSAIWRTETVSPGPGLAPELAVRADMEIPERRMTVTWSLRRNTDKALPASHTIEIMFNLPADFAGGGIANVPGILMKQAEQARGTPLAGLAVKVTNGFFLIGLSAVEADVQRNMQLLKDRSWFDIPIVYTNGGRAILAMEKGPPGDRAFAEAFAAWAK